MSYAACCRKCGYVETQAYHPSSTAKDNDFAGLKIGVHPKDKQAPVALTARGHVPSHCPKCGDRGPQTWPVEATKEDIAKYEERLTRDARAAELCTTQNIAGLFKIPDEATKGPVEVRNALSNLLAPLEGELLKLAQANVVKAAKMGVQGGNEMWVELFYQAIENAKKMAKKATVAA